MPPPKDVLRYDETYGSYYSLKAGVNTPHPGRFNVAIGDDVLANAVDGNANYNVVHGQRALWKNQTGDNNVALGWEALRENTSGNDNVAISEDALRDNLRGSGNVAVGRGAMISNTVGRLNTAVGYNALQNEKESSENVAVGDYAGAFLGRGEGNVFIGSYAGENNGNEQDGKTDNSRNVCIGQYAGISDLKGSDNICIGANTQVEGNRKWNIGNAIYGSDMGLTGAKLNIEADVTVKSILIGGRKITADDNFIYVETSTGVKKIALT